MMQPSFAKPSSSSLVRRSALHWLLAGASLGSLAATNVYGQTTSSSAQLATRADLTAAATRAEAAASKGDPGRRMQSAMVAASIRERLRDGDFQVGDRIVVTIVSDAVHRDTVVVRSGRVMELMGMVVVPVSGVLRSELRDRVSSEVLKYVKAQQIEVTPLMRVGVLGAVARPGYFAFPSDIPLTDAIMGAGGPGPTADLERSVVRRKNQEFRSAEETRSAIAGGLTLDQFGLNAGDELVIGQRSGLSSASIMGMVGGLASVLALVVTLRK
jgi:SLBB domain-containing protein